MLNDLVFIKNNEVVTDSLTVSEVFSKRHSDVIRAIESLNCSKEFNERNFALVDYEDSKGEKRKKYLLKRDGLVFLVMGFTGKQAGQFKEKYIKAFNEMETQLKELVSPSYMIEDPIKRAQKWIEEQKEKKQLEGEKLMLQQEIAEAKPKVTYVDEILNSKDTVTVSQIAADYGLTAQKLNAVLNEEGIQYKVNGQWLLYAKHRGNGYTKSHTVDIQHTDGSTSAKMNTRWTQKGRLYIHNILTNRGIIANMDKESQEGVESA